MMKIRYGFVAASGLAISSAAYAQPGEIEPNDLRSDADANPVWQLAGDAAGVITGESTGAKDTFRVRTAANPLGIYRNRLSITSAAAHSGSILGRAQTAAAAATWEPGMNVGTASAPNELSSAQNSGTVGGVARTVQWYSFGRPADIYYRVSGAVSTPDPYNVDYDIESVVPIPGPTNLNGNGLVITAQGQGHTTNTDFWVYDSNFNAIRGYGNEDNSTEAIGGVPGSPGAGLAASLRRDYADGTYYLAITNTNLANDQGSPSDDRTRTGVMLDFPDTVLNSSTTPNLNVTVNIGGTQVPATKVGQFDIVWIRFTVPTPGCAALLGLGGLVAMRRRR